MRRRLLLVIPAVVVLAAGIAIAVYATRKPPSGELETAVTDVTVVAPTVPETPRPTPRPPKPKPPAPEVDKRCWPMFGGGPTRDLARLDIDLVWDPIWTPDLITDRGFELLGRTRTRTLT